MRFLGRKREVSGVAVCCGFGCGGIPMGNTDKSLLKDDKEIEALYQLYIRVQSGDKDALNELFKKADSKQIHRIDMMNKEYKISHMENVLDSEIVLDDEKNMQKKEWINSSNSKVAFQFACLNKLLYKKKKYFLSEGKNTGYENDKKLKNGGNRKYYDGEYDISDFNELMYETIIEVFNTDTDENNCLTLDGKKNVNTPICDGVSLLRNISYFTSRKINKRAKTSRLDIYDIEYLGEESETGFSNFDKYAFKKFSHAGGGMSRLTMYAEYLEWIRKYDIHKLFKRTSCNIKAIVQMIMECEDTFTPNASGDIESGFGMRFVSQETLQEMIKMRYGMNIEQENISRDLELMEQRLLDHLFYSLNYEIGKAEKSEGIYEKESERFLYELSEKAYIKMFDRASYEIYEKSIDFINSGISVKDFNNYFKIVKKYEEMILGVVTKEKGKMKYDMVNLLSENDNDLVDNKTEALFNIANTLIASYQKREDEYRRKHFGDYKTKGLKDWNNGFWEARLEEKVLNIRFWTRKDVKFPIRYKLNREKVIVYCGYMNYYFCDKEGMVCYKVPKDRRVIGRYNKNHEIFLYNVG